MTTVTTESRCRVPAVISGIWTFNADGKISGYCHKLDTHQHWLACGGDHARQVLTEPAH